MHGGSITSVRVRRHLARQLLREGKQTVCEGEEEGVVVRANLVLSFFLACYASELFAYDDTELVVVYPEICRGNAFRQGSLFLSCRDFTRGRVGWKLRAIRLRRTRPGEERRLPERDLPRYGRPTGDGG